jgi:hypothetical protein
MVMKPKAPSFLTLLACLAAAPACASEVALEDRPCPCAEGWVCCPESNVCAQRADACTSAPAGTRACDNRAIESTCADYPEGTTAEDAASSCDGVVQTQPCPKDEAVGTCSVTLPAGVIVNTYYSVGPRAWTEATARETCETQHGGVFGLP